MNNDDHKRDIIDEDLYEEIEEEELYELVQEEKRKALTKEQAEKAEPKRPFPKWAFWLIAIIMVVNLAAVIPQTFSIPAIDFLLTSAKLSNDSDIQEYKKSIVVIEAGQSKGTGFAITPDGKIITNHHVIEGKKRISVAFPEEGLFQAEIKAAYPEVDLAILDVEGKGLPYLELATETSFKEGTSIYFIGNPLHFTGIANKGSIIGYTDLDDWSQPVLMLDAPIYKGNSGSPVINEDGRVIGVVFATLRHDEHGKVGLAVPIDYYYQKID